MALYIAVAALVLMAPICWWPDISNWWRVLRAHPETFPHLTVAKIKDIDHFLAWGPLDTMVSIRLSPDEKTSPNLKVGERISVSGKRTRRMKGGRHEIVQATVRSYDI